MTFFCHHPWLLMDAVKDVASFALLLQQQPDSQMPAVTQAYASHALDHLQVCYSLSELSLPLVFNVAVGYGGTLVQLCITATLWSIPLAGIYAHWCWFLTYVRSTLNSCFATALSRGAYIMPLNTCHPAIQSVWWAYSFGDSVESPITSTFFTWCKHLLLQVWCH